MRLHDLDALVADAVAALAVGTILLVRRLRPHWPSYLIAVALASILAVLLQLPVETIGSRFGGIPQALPGSQLHCRRVR